MPNSAARSQLYQQVTRAAALGLAVNLALGVIKLVAGIYSRSFALMSDAINSIGDSFTSIVVLIALRVAQRPPDDEHPYGHTRAEAIAGSNVALIIILSALLIGWHTLTRWGTRSDLPPTWTLWIAGANVAIKEALYQYKIRIGKRTGSSALIAHAWDHRADAFCSLAVLLGLALVRFGGPTWHRADEGAALVVVVAIIVSSARVFRASAVELMDVQADPAMVEAVRAAAEAIDGVHHVETLRLRKTGIEYLADIHIEVDKHMTVAAGHKLGHDMKDELMRRFSTLRDVLVHLEPHEG